MKFTELLLYIGLAIIAFWALGLLLKLASWVVEIALIVGLALIVVSLIKRFANDRKARRG